MIDGVDDSMMNSRWEVLCSYLCGAFIFASGGGSSLIVRDLVYELERRSAKPKTVNMCHPSGWIF